MVTKHTGALPPYHISIIPFIAIHHREIMPTNTLLEIEENPFFSIEQPNITIIPTLQKLESKTPNKFMAILWNPGGHSITINKNTTIGYVKNWNILKIPKLTNKKISGKFPKYLGISYHLCLRSPHLHFTTASTQSPR